MNLILNKNTLVCEVNPNKEQYKNIPNNTLKPKLTQPNHYTFEQWCSKYNDELKNILLSLHTFLQNLCKDGYVICPYVSSTIDEKLLHVIYQNSINKYKSYNFLK
jgi:hypothetical protein